MRFLVEGVGACEVGKTADGGRNRSLVQERVPEVRGTTVIKEKQNATALPLTAHPQRLQNMVDLRPLRKRGVKKPPSDFAKSKNFTIKNQKDGEPPKFGQCLDTPAT